MLSSKALAGTALAVAVLGLIGLVYADAAVLVPESAWPESACIKADKTAAATKHALPTPKRCAVVASQ